MTTSVQHHLQTCPYCGGGKITVHADDTETIVIGRKKRTVGNLQRSNCSECGKSFVTPAQHDANVEAIRQARLELTPISPKEIRLIRARLGISQNDAQRMFAGGKNAFSKYERGEVAPSLASARLMKAALTVPGLARYLAEQAGVKVNPAWDSIPEDAAPASAPRALLEETGRRVVEAEIARALKDVSYEDVLESMLRAVLTDPTAASYFESAGRERVIPLYETGGSSKSSWSAYELKGLLTPIPHCRGTPKIDEFTTQMNFWYDTRQLIEEGPMRRHALANPRIRKSRT